MKIFKNFKIKSFVYNLLVCLAYPIIKCIISNSNKLLVLSDTLCIMGMVFIVAGIVTSFILHGDFDITTFIAKRSFKRDSDFTYEKFQNEQQKKREGSFNYPLFVGIFVIIISYIIALFC